MDYIYTKRLDQCENSLCERACLFLSICSVHLGVIWAKPLYILHSFLVQNEPASVRMWI